MLIDTHLHLDFDQFDADRDAVVARAGAAGVAALITIGTTRATSARAVALAEQYPSVWAAVGVHPNEATEWGTEAERELRAWASHPKVVAVGEIGLDDYWKRIPLEVQQRAFEAQLALAADVGLPVIIHDRDAHAAVLDTLRTWVLAEGRERCRGVLHFFSGDLPMAEEALALGFFLGTDGPLTFKNATAMQAVIRAVPLDRLLIETDAPFLAPHPYRGQRNEPAFVPHVAEKVAALHGTTFERVAQQTTANACSLFGFKLEP